MREDTLLDIVAAMKENVGIVHQMPFVCDRKGFAGVLEKVSTCSKIRKARYTNQICKDNTVVQMLQVS